MTLIFILAGVYIFFGALLIAGLLHAAATTTPVQDETADVEWPFGEEERFK